MELFVLIAALCCFSGQTNGQAIRFKRNGYDMVVSISPNVKSMGSVIDQQIIDNIKVNNRILLSTVND